MMIMNVNVSPGWDGDETKDATLFGSIGNTISEVFPSVFYIRLKTGNAMVLAFKENKSLETLLDSMKKVDTKYRELQSLISYSIKRVKKYKRNYEALHFYSL